MFAAASGMKWSGTSMATPTVTNLAAKLIALESSLTPAEVVKADSGRDHESQAPEAHPVSPPIPCAPLIAFRSSESAAEQLALDLDSDTNNTSLVLAFEWGAPGKGAVLLFAGDAQVGNGSPGGIRSTATAN